MLISSITYVLYYPHTRGHLIDTSGLWVNLGCPADAYETLKIKDKIVKIFWGRESHETTTLFEAVNGQSSRRPTCILRNVWQPLVI